MSRLLPPSGGNSLLDIPEGTFKQGEKFIFTFYYPETDGWEGGDYEISVA